MTDTRMGNALKRAGIKPEENDLLIAIARWQNNGGTLLRLIELARGAYELPGEGRTGTADDGRCCNADARQPNGDVAGHEERADEGRSRLARPSPAESSAEGQRALAGKATEPLPSAAAPHRDAGGRPKGAEQAKPTLPPAREPNAVQLAAARKVRATASASIWERSIGGSLKLGTATKFDLRQLARKFRIGEHSINRLLTELNWPDDDKSTLPQVASERQVKDILESGARSLNALESGHA